MNAPLHQVQRVLLVCGMHRSGTSVVAGWLHQCGLDLGEEFYEATYGNPRGHFEDLDFVGFHKQMLAEMGLDFVLKPDQKLAMPSAAVRDAYAILREKGGRRQWGFKDPRTSLFLDFWSARLVDPKILAMVRPWPLVVASLLRRDTRQPADGLKKRLIPYWHHPQNRLLVNRYLGTWIRYNEAILTFAQERPANVLLVASEALPGAAGAVYQHLTEKWNFSLKPVDISATWHDEAFTRSIPALRANKKLEARAKGVWEALSAHASMLPERESSSAQRSV